MYRSIGFVVTMCSIVIDLGCCHERDLVALDVRTSQSSFQNLGHL